MEATRERRKVLMLPWLAFGHISPFAELAKKLSLNNFHVYLCSSPINLQSIRPRLPENFSASVELVELNLPSLPELPPHMHTTNGLPLHLIPTLAKALDMATPEFSTILHKLSPNLLITDIFQPWAIQLAASLNIPVVTLLVTGAGAFCLPIPNVEYSFPELDLTDHWISKKYERIPEDSSINVGENRFLQWLQSLELCSNVILVNSFPEIEAKYMDYLCAWLKKKVVPVGPLVQEAVESADEKSDVLEWLDKKPPKSTVYVSFGSEYYLTKEDMEELAHGLELSGANFIWVVRFPKGDKKMRIEEALPDGFMERVGERGMVVDGWAPQLKILAHVSTGGFVCHCGWNSVVEAVMHGVPIIALPMQLDQPYHARVAVAAGVSVEAARGAEGSVEREGVAKAVKEVVFGKTGESLNEKAREICEVLKAKKSGTIEEYVNELSQLCQSRQVCIA